MREAEEAKKRLFIFVVLLRAFPTYPFIFKKKSVGLLLAIQAL